MRLIDADKLVKAIENENHGFSISGAEEKYARIIQVNMQSTVEAIPIAWLEMFMHRYKIQGGNEYKLLHFMTTEWKKWEKENGN